MWIALIAFALIGIVALQLLVLSLNTGMGRALERQARLQRENAALNIEDSELASGERVQTQAQRLGMQLVPIGALRFLTADPHVDLVRAAATLNEPVQSPAAGSSEAGAGASASSSAAAGASGVAQEQPSAASASSSAAAGASGVAQEQPSAASASSSAAAGASGAAQEQPSAASASSSVQASNQALAPG